MVLTLWIVLPLALIHWWTLRRRRDLFRFQLLLDVILAAVLGPAVLIGGDLNPVRCLEPLPPFKDVTWSEHTENQPTQSDLVLQFHPWWEATGRFLRWGRLPLIQPGVGAGLPLVANGQAGVLAPVMLPVWLHGPERGTTIMAAWKIETAGVGAFLLLSALGLRWRAAAVGGIGWGGSLYLIGWLLVPLAWVTALLPWVWRLVLWGVRQSVWRMLATGALIGWLMGSGLHPETAAVVSGSALLAAMIIDPRRWVRAAVVVGVSGVVAVALSWPTVGLIRASSRHALTAEHAVNRDRPSWEIQRDLIRQMVVPAAHGQPDRGDWTASYPHAPGAIGVGGILLGLLAVGTVRRPHRRLAWAAAASATIGAILLIRIPPIDALLVRIPPLDQMTLPRFGVLIPWGLTVLAACSLEGFLDGRARRGWIRFVPAVIVAGVAIPSVWAGLGFWSQCLIALSIGSAIAAGVFAANRMLPVLVVLELALLAVGVNPVADRADRLPLTPLIERLEALNREVPARIIGLDRAFPPNLATRYGLRDLRASDPLRPVPFARLMGVLGEPATILGGPIRRAPAGLLGAWGVRYAVTRPGRRLEGWTEAYSGTDGRIWINPRWSEEVRVVGAVTVEPDDQSDLVHVVDRMDWGREVLVEPGTPPIHAEQTSLELEFRAPARLEAMIECDGPCLVSFAQAWAPGWRATVDEEPAPIYLTNIAGVGVRVQAGRHRVEVGYDPWVW